MHAPLTPGHFRKIAIKRMTMMSKSELRAWLGGIFTALIYVNATDKQIIEIVANWIAIVNSTLGTSESTCKWSCHCFKSIVESMQLDPDPLVKEAVARLNNL